MFKDHGYGDNYIIHSFPTQIIAEAIQQLVLSKQVIRATFLLAVTKCLTEANQGKMGLFWFKVCSYIPSLWGKGAAGL